MSHYDAFALRLPLREDGKGLREYLLRVSGTIRAQRLGWAEDKQISAAVNAHHRGDVIVKH